MLEQDYLLTSDSKQVFSVFNDEKKNIADTQYFAERFSD